MPYFSGHAAVKQRLQVPHRQAESVLRNNGQFLPAFIPCFQHCVAFFQRSGHGLFTDYVFAALQCVNGYFSMYKRRSAYVNKVNILVQDFMVIQINVSVQAILFLDTLCLSGDNIHKGSNPAPVREFQVCLDVRM